MASVSEQQNPDGSIDPARDDVDPQTLSDLDQTASDGDQTSSDRDRGFGGDEFVCSLSGQDIDGVRDRFERIAQHLADAANGATFTLGLAEQQQDDTLDELIRRADAAMLEARQP
jgi:hypothetical protein